MACFMLGWTGRWNSPVFAFDKEMRLVGYMNVSSEPGATIRELREASGDYVRIGLEAGQLSQWSCFGLKDAGLARLPVVYLKARRAKAAIVAMNKNPNDRNDARSLAQLVRLGWFKAEQVQSKLSQELRTLLNAREFYLNKLRDHENEIRRLLRPFGMTDGKVAA